MAEDNFVRSDFPYGSRQSRWHEALSPLALSTTGRLLVTPPSVHPLAFEQDDLQCPEGITPAFYQVPSTGLTLEEHDRAMAETEMVVKQSAEFHLGFMNSLDLQLSSSDGFGSLVLNNGGDPYEGMLPLSYDVKWMERNVLDYFASLWNARWPHRKGDKENYWGYVLSMGSTEGNLHALWTARKVLSSPSAKVSPTEESENPLKSVNRIPVVFLSRNCNYSLYKCCNIVNISTFDSVGRELYPGEDPLGGDWSPGVPCNGGDTGPGTIDIDALEKLVDFFSSRGHPTVVVFNYGSTIKGSCDDVKIVRERVVTVLKRNNMYQLSSVDSQDSTKHHIFNGFWFHVDGALSAAYMPFLEMAYENGLTDVKPAPTFDFRLDFISSIVCSGHKYIGIPWPCGIYLVHNMQYLKEWNIGVTDSVDHTISLSRNGHSSVALWSYIASNS